MTAEGDIEIQRIKAMWQLLSKRFAGTADVSAVFTFKDLAGIPLLSNRLAFEHTLGIICEHGDKKITYRTVKGPPQVFPGHNPLSGSVMDRFDPVPPPTIVPGEPIGYEIFVSDPNELDEYFLAIIKRPIRLSELSVEFNDHEPAITVGDRKSILPAALNEHLLCRTMFAVPAHRAVDWSEIYEAMTGNDPLEAGPKEVSNKKQVSAHTRMVRDAMYAVNERLKHDLNTQDELFSWENKSVTRNF